MSCRLSQHVYTADFAVTPMKPWAGLQQTCGSVVLSAAGSNKGPEAESKLGVKINAKDSGFASGSRTSSASGAPKGSHS